MSTAETPRAKLEAWRSANLPPKGMRKHADLPIYSGSHEKVSAFAMPLADLMAELSAHIFDECNGKTPRWMTVPKVLFGVKRINLVKTSAKASRRFDNIEDLVSRCGRFSRSDTAKLSQWLINNPGGEFVAHKKANDLRAYVFSEGDEAPKRIRYYQSGLVVATTKKFVMLDHQGTARDKRSDAYVHPLARTARDWVIYGVEKGE